MSLLATLIAVAAWCSIPSSGGLTIAQVDKCRQELLECLDKTPHNPKCFTDKKLDTDK